MPPIWCDAPRPGKRSSSRSRVVRALDWCRRDPHSWRRWGDVAEMFTGPADPDWERDRELVGDDLTDPWAER